MAVQVTAPPKTAWQPASSGRPSGPVQLHVDVLVHPVGGKGVVTLLGVGGPGIAEGQVRVGAPVGHQADAGIAGLP